MVDKSLLFDNDHYYELYPDVLEAVKDGVFRNGYEHYSRHGKSENRQCKFQTELEHKIDKVNYGWSNHLTLQGYEEQPKPIVNLNMVDVPKEFQPVQSVEYPSGNKAPFERYFTDKLKELKPNVFRTFLPIHWTAIYVNSGYGKDKGELQKYLNSLDKSKQYFTIIQYDDGILEDISGLDILVYSMGCKKEGYYPIPLVCQPTNNNPQKSDEKLIGFSFTGANTHPIREKLVQEWGVKMGYDVSFNSMSHDDYIKQLKETAFALCPRGYGVTSFRLYEAMAFGCIPVYISDEFWEPFNLPFTEYGIKITEDQIKDIPEILKGIDIPKIQAKVRGYYESYFVYSNCANSIIKTLTI